MGDSGTNGRRDQINLSGKRNKPKLVNPKILSEFLKGPLFGLFLFFISGGFSIAVGHGIAFDRLIHSFVSGLLLSLPLC
jgi:hypothetical protein